MNINIHINFQRRLTAEISSTVSAVKTNPSNPKKNIITQHQIHEDHHTLSRFMCSLLSISQLSGQMCSNAVCNFITDTAVALHFIMSV